MKNNKAFTMVELLAVITIVGILSVISIASVSSLIDKTRKNEVEEQKKIAALAAESYLQFNKGKLPKIAGDDNSVSISFQELKASNFLKEDIKSPSGDSCMNESSVIVVKKVNNNNQYTYTTYLKCNGKEY